MKLWAHFIVILVLVAISPPSNLRVIEDSAMSFSVAVIETSGGDVSGNQDITKSGFGTPKAAIFITSYNPAAARGDYAQAHFSFGFTDGTNQYVATMLDLDGLGTTDAHRRQATDEVIMFLDDNTPANVEQEANFVQWITDGVRINWATSNPPSDRAVTVILLGGTDLSAKVNTVTFGTEDTLVHVTDVGFEADALITAGVGADGTTGLDSDQAHSVYGLGLVHNGVSVTQRGIAFMSQDNLVTSNIGGILMTNGAGGQVTISGVTWRADFSNFDSAGFDCHSRGGDSASDIVGYLALKVAGRTLWVGTVDAPTATGNNSQTGPAFQPDFVMQILSMATAIDTHDVTGKHGAFGVSVIDSAGAESYEGVAMEDGAGTSNTARISDADAINLDDDDGTDAFDATYVSMDANGWTLNFSAADGTTRKWIGFAISAAAGTTVTKDGSLNLTGAFQRLAHLSRTLTGEF